MAEKKIPKRKDISEAHKWVLTPLFETDDLWEALFREVEQKLD